MSKCALGDWTPILLPDGTWCVWSERTQLPLRMGSTQLAILPEVSQALGSIDKAHDAIREAHADPDRWARLLASLPPAEARGLARKVGVAVESEALRQLRPLLAGNPSGGYAVEGQPGSRSGGPSTNVRSRRNPPLYDVQIAALHAQGLHTSAISAEVGCSDRTVGKAYKRLKLTPNPIRPREYDAQVKALHAQGLRTCQIAQRLNLTRRLAASRLESFGLTPNVAVAP